MPKKKKGCFFQQTSPRRTGPDPKTRRDPNRGLSRLSDGFGALSLIQMEGPPVTNRSDRKAKHDSLAMKEDGLEPPRPAQPLSHPAQPQSHPATQPPSPTHLPKEDLESRRVHKKESDQCMKPRNLRTKLRKPKNK